MKHFIVRYLEPRETWLAADDEKEAYARALKMLQIHNSSPVPALLHSIEPAPTNGEDLLPVIG